MEQLKSRGGLTVADINTICKNFDSRTTAQEICSTLNRSVVWWSPVNAKEPLLFCWEEAEIFRLSYKGTVDVSKFDKRLRVFWLHAGRRLTDPNRGKLRFVGPTLIAHRESTSSSQHGVYGPRSLTEADNVEDLLKTGKCLLMSGNEILAYHTRIVVDPAMRKRLKLLWDRSLST